MRVFLCFWFVFIVGQASAANVYVIDGGLHPTYYPQIENDLIAESCYSIPGDNKRQVATDENNTSHSHFYEYRYASLCKNKSSEQHGAGASILRVDDLPGATGIGNVPDVSVPVSVTTHQAVIADVIQSFTSASVKQWHAHAESLLGLNLLGELDWTKYDVLTQISSIPFLNQAFSNLGNGTLGLKGVKVVSFSQIFPGAERYQQRYATPCDSHGDILSPGVYRDMAAEFSRLNNLGVTVVVATDNTQNDKDLDNYDLPFPSCLSTTVSVGGIDKFGDAQGAIGPHIHFIEDFTHRDPVTTGLVSGTSFATPKVASYLAELRTIVPTLTSNDALNTLRNTGDLVCGSRFYDGGAVQIDYCIPRPNFADAQESITDSFWNDLIELITGTTDTEKYGWNYGTSRHSNGILSFFETITLPQENQMFSTQRVNDEKSLPDSVGQSVLRYSFRPFDIDTTDELEILVNDKSYGFVTPTGSDLLGSTQTVCIEESDLKTDGSNNEVKLQLTTSGEKWGVTDLKIEVGVSDAGCISAPPPPEPPVDPVNESVVLTVGTTDQNQYGRNYGRNGSTDILDVSFIAQAGVNHEISWQPFDIESGEMEVFLNNQKLKGIPTTDPNDLGEMDTYTALSQNLLANINVLSFRVTGGDETWGVTNLLVDTVSGSDPSDPSSVVLLDVPTAHEYIPTNASYLTRFDFAPRGMFYDETLTIEFDSFVPQGVVAGFNVFLNGVHRLLIPISSGQSELISHSLSLEKSELAAGENILIIASTRVASTDTTNISNLKIIHETTPQLDVRVSSPSVTDDIVVAQPLNTSTVVSNLRTANAPANTLTFFVSDNIDKTNEITLSSLAVPAIPSGSSVTLVSSIISSEIKNGGYLWVCIDSLQGDLDSSNDCSDPLLLDVKGPSAIPAIINLLMEDGV